ncbi:hypothetical protein H0H81_003438 [Sphagnurus paluster]|uniref:Potassium transport protein n=1 Tax=Sphagnurus paluster TaxID=117069 RepID=A0A9P7FWR7_9AGAR|nr:hypothetical protein H0H81_003438 [Sphagnurus paluster]
MSQTSSDDDSDGEDVLKAIADQRAAQALADGPKLAWPSRISTFLLGGRGDLSAATGAGPDIVRTEKKKGLMQKLRPDMITRVDTQPTRINPSGQNAPSVPTTHLSFAASSTLHEHVPKSPPDNIAHDGEKKTLFRRLSDPGTPSRPSTPIGGESVPVIIATSTYLVSTDVFPRSDTVKHEKPISPVVSPDISTPFNRTQTIEFAPNVQRRRTAARGIAKDEILEHDRASPEALQSSGEHRAPYNRRASFSRQNTVTTAYTSRTHGSRNYMTRGFGGFPMPFTIIKNLFYRVFPKLKRRVTRTITIPATMSIASQNRESAPPGAKVVPYISFNATVGRNSNFKDLSQSELDELGGVEYRALNALLWIVGGYHIITQLITFIVIAPYISMPKWHENFVPPDEIRPQSTVWFSMFQSVSAYTNTGMSLVDHSMVPFQKAYPMIFFMAFLILAGNTAFTGAIPLGTRFVVGLFQAIAVRSAGFSVVSIAALAAAVKVLYVVMMYISVYPIAMSIRSTNVYEEQSLGIFPEDDLPDEADFEPTGDRVTVWGRYLALHARKQLAFDMWWLGLALFLVCINERHNLDDPVSAIWFNIFSVVFEIVSAYGTVGLSLGTPNNNFSFSGELKTLSKFIIIVVMIRGRHRVLPVAIDRAVLLPSDQQEKYDQDIHHNASHSANHAEDETYDLRPNQRRHSHVSYVGEMRPQSDVFLP